ncbi:TetR/AcrR family transcriptional regulator [Streptomyces pharetrae]|jgi:AcrR family transcriptional regulator
MTDPAPARRPGGRTARVRADVHRAVEELLREQPLAQLTIAQIAERSGVHQGTLYRRWQSLDGLLLDVVTEHLVRHSPMPDTGTLAGDLEQYARQTLDDLSGPQGKLLLRTLVAVRQGPESEAELPPALLRRYDELQALLDRAAARGEHPPTVQDVVDLIVAPMYTGLLLDGTPGDEDTARRLVDRIHRLSQTS